MIKKNRLLKNALIERFFSSVIIFLISYGCGYAESIPTTCVSTHYDERVEIDYVIDGDTVILKDQRHVRMIGINTPELDHQKKQHQAGAVEARNALQMILYGQNKVRLQFDSERKDRHGRTLAHLYLEDGTNIQALMLIRGLAMSLTIPPNLLNLACYNKSADIAKADRLGLWGLGAYQSKAVASLNGKERGFHIIHGSVQRITESRSSIWLNLENNVALRIVRNDLEYFGRDSIDALEGQQVEAKGWLYRKKGQLRMRLRHNSDINIRDRTDNIRDGQ